MISIMFYSLIIHALDKILNNLKRVLKKKSDPIIKIIQMFTLSLIAPFNKWKNFLSIAQQKSLGQNI